MCRMYPNRNRLRRTAHPGHPVPPPVPSPTSPAPPGQKKKRTGKDRTRNGRDRGGGGGGLLRTTSRVPPDAIPPSYERRVGDLGLVLVSDVGGRVGVWWVVLGVVLGGVVSGCPVWAVVGGLDWSGGLDWCCVRWVRVS